MVLLGISTTVGAINFVVTLLECVHPAFNRPGTDPRMGTLTASVANIFAIPSVSLAFFLLWLDRQIGTHSSMWSMRKALLWQHLFWMFGIRVYRRTSCHGIVSDALPTFCRGPVAIRQ